MIKGQQPEIVQRVSKRFLKISDSIEKYLLLNKNHSLQCKSSIDSSVNLLIVRRKSNLLPIFEPLCLVERLNSGGSKYRHTMEK